MLPTMFQVNWPFSSGEEGKNLVFPIRTILAIFFYLQVTLKLPTQVQANWPSGSEVKMVLILDFRSE